MWKPLGRINYHKGGKIQSNVSVMKQPCESGVLFSCWSLPHNFQTSMLHMIFETSKFCCPLCCPSVLEEMESALAVHRMNQCTHIYLKWGRPELTNDWSAQSWLQLLVCCKGYTGANFAVSFMTRGSGNMGWMRCYHDMQREVTNGKIWKIEDCVVTSQAQLLDMLRKTSKTQ